MAICSRLAAPARIAFTVLCGIGEDHHIEVQLLDDLLGLRLEFFDGT
jgi:hypothetical protein